MNDPIVTVDATGRIIETEPPQDGQVLQMQGGTFRWTPMGGSENTLFVSGGWCAPSATFYGVVTGQPPPQETLL